jgi:flagellar biosynthesis protein FlhG
MEIIHTQHGTRRFELLVNMANNATEARSVFENLGVALERFGKEMSLEYLGFIPKDDNFEKAAREQSPVLQRYPESASSRGFFDLADRLMANSENGPSDGNIKFFWRKLMSCHRDVSGQ